MKLHMHIHYATDTSAFSQVNTCHQEKVHKSRFDTKTSHAHQVIKSLLSHIKLPNLSILLLSMNRKMFNPKLRLNQGMWKRNWEVTGNQTQVTGLSHQCSDHWAMTTHDSQFSHITVVWWYCYTAVSHPTAISVCRQNTFQCRPVTILPPGLEKSHTNGF